MKKRTLEEELEHYIQSWEYYDICSKTDTMMIDTEYLKDIYYNKNMYKRYANQLVKELDTNWNSALEKYSKLKSGEV